MNTPTAVPVTVSDEAAAHVADLGLQEPFERMVEQALKIPGLRSLQVTLAPAYDLGQESVLLEAICDEALFDPHGPEERAFSEWKVTTFPPDVRQHFCLLTYHG